MIPTVAAARKNETFSTRLPGVAIERNDERRVNKQTSVEERKNASPASGLYVFFMRHERLSRKRLQRSGYLLEETVTSQRLNYKL